MKLQYVQSELKMNLRLELSICRICSEMLKLKKGFSSLLYVDPTDGEDVVGLPETGGHLGNLWK